MVEMQQTSANVCESKRAPKPKAAKTGHISANMTIKGSCPFRIDHAKVKKANMAVKVETKAQHINRRGGVTTKTRSDFLHAFVNPSGNKKTAQNIGDNKGTNLNTSSEDATKTNGISAKQKDDKTIQNQAGIKIPF